jgi:serine/threonine protein kinase
MQNSRDVDHRTDLWSLGCVLYAALSGRAPQQHLGTIGQLVLATCTAPAPPITSVAPWVPPEVAEAVHRALQIQPEARYPTAEAMLRALRALLPAGSLTAETLADSARSSGERVASPAPRPGPSTLRSERPARPTSPPSSADVSPRIVVTPSSDVPIRGDADTEQAHDRAPSHRASPWSLGENDTLRSEPPAQPALPRSGVPAVGARAGARTITVDPRRFLGQQSELWTYSLDVHRGLGSLLARVWKSLRRAGAKVPPMTYGAEWVLFEPRTRRVIEEAPEGAPPLGLEDAGIRPGTILWVVRPDAVPSEGGPATRAAPG